MKETKLPNDVQKCTGQTQKGVECHEKMTCKRYLSYTIADEVYTPVGFAPDCIATSRECPLKIPV